MLHNNFESKLRNKNKKISIKIYEKRINYKKYNFLNDFIFSLKNNMQFFKYINNNFNNFLKKQLKFFKFIIKYFYFCLKRTKSNFFCYLMNYKNCIGFLSLGQTNFKGPAKNSIDAYEILGQKFGFRLFKFYLFLLKKYIIMSMILILSIKIYKGLKKLFRKFLELGLKFSFIFVLYKFAHNGPRKKNMKRR